MLVHPMFCNPANIKNRLEILTISDGVIGNIGIYILGLSSKPSCQNISRSFESYPEISFSQKVNCNIVIS